MEITNCPECHDEVVSAGFALWEGFTESVEVFECVNGDCGWVGVEVEYWAQRELSRTAA